MHPFVPGAEYFPLFGPLFPCPTGCILILIHMVPVSSKGWFKQPCGQAPASLGCSSHLTRINLQLRKVFPFVVNGTLMALWRDLARGLGLGRKAKSHDPHPSQAPIQLLFWRRKRPQEFTSCLAWPSRVAPWEIMGDNEQCWLDEPGEDRGRAS